MTDLTTRTAVREAALTTNIRDAWAKWYHAGISLIPCFDKKPLIKNWLQYQREAADKTVLLDAWRRYGLKAQIGVICGEVSRNLAVLDIDAMELCAEAEAAIPWLKQTLSVLSGSGRGRHYYMFSTCLPKTTITKGTELRTDGAYVIAPPSLYNDDGKQYRTLNEGWPMLRTDLRDVQDWIISRRPQVEIRPQAPSVYAKSAFTEAALSDECRLVLQAGKGSTNNALNRAAFKLGQLVVIGQLSRPEVEQRLEAAAHELSDRDGIAATRRTIQSGLNAGMQNPRRLS